MLIHLCSSGSNFASTSRAHFSKKSFG